MIKISTTLQTCRMVLMVANARGLHLRPASQLVNVASQFDADIVVEHKGRKANAKSLIGVVTLRADEGARLTVKARGQDAPEALKAIRDLFCLVSPAAA